MDKVKGIFGGSRKSTSSGAPAATGGSASKEHSAQTLRALVSGVDLHNNGYDKFEKFATLGTGTFGRVRLVKVKGGDGTPFALKILKKSEVLRLKQVDHILDEKSILQNVTHPFIVTLVSSFQDNWRLFMLMEYVSGGELFSYLRRKGHLPQEDCKFYAAEIVLAFQYLHSMKVAYRDLKPENLLINRDGHLKITDFGFAKVIEDRAWTLCGTPEYLAPEIIQSKGHGKSVDWWALGVLMYEMLAGYPPFYDENPFGIYQKILAGRIEFPKQDRFDVKVRDLIKRLLTNDRTKRLGCLKGGADDLKKHKWFKDLDWDKVYTKELKPPFVPQIRSDDDTSMFDVYPESSQQPVNIPDKFQKLFDKFPMDF